MVEVDVGLEASSTGGVLVELVGIPGVGDNSGCAVSDSRDDVRWIEMP